MNYYYVERLIDCKRVGKLIKLIKDNEFNWSISDYKYLFSIVMSDDYYDIFYFLMEIFNKRKLIENKISMDNIYKICNGDNIKIVKHLFSCVEFTKRLSDCILTFSFLEDTKYIETNNIIKCISSHEMQIRYNFDVGYSAYFSDTRDFSAAYKALKFGDIKTLKYLLTNNIQQKFPKVILTDDVFILSFIKGNLNNDDMKYIYSSEVQDLYPKIFTSVYSDFNRILFSRGNLELVKYLFSSDVYNRLNIDVPKRIIISDAYRFAYSYVMNNRKNSNEILEFLFTDDIQERFPDIRSCNITPRLIKNIEKKLGYSV